MSDEQPVRYIPIRFSRAPKVRPPLARVFGAEGLIIQILRAEPPQTRRWLARAIILGQPFA